MGLSFDSKQHCFAIAHTARGSLLVYLLWQTFSEKKVMVSFVQQEIHICHVYAVIELWAYLPWLLYRMPLLLQEREPLAITLR